jgi:hypothetical protein
VGLWLGNLSLHSTLLQAGAQHSQSPMKADTGAVISAPCAGNFRKATKFRTANAERPPVNPLIPWLGGSTAA